MAKLLRRRSHTSAELTTAARCGTQRGRRKEEAKEATHGSRLEADIILGAVLAPFLIIYPFIAVDSRSLKVENGPFFAGDALESLEGI